jgi:hypothetical protein
MMVVSLSRSATKGTTMQVILTATDLTAMPTALRQDLHDLLEALAYETDGEAPGPERSRAC